MRVRRDRRTTAAPDFFRCTATVAHDGYTETCVRWSHPDSSSNPAINAKLCTQHADMVLAGKTVQTTLRPVARKTVQTA